MPEATRQSATQKLLARFETEKLVAVIRTETAEDAVWAASQVIEGGMPVVEITMTVPDTPGVIEKLCERYPEAVIGAGTVLEARHAIHALGAGAQFLVSPVLEEALVRLGSEQDILVLPGTMTPTEIYRAMGWGAQAVKFFPAEAAGGAAFVSAVLGPVPEAKIIPTGGITLSHVEGYFKAGVLAVGIGGPLMPKAVIARRDEQALRANVHAYLEIRNHFTAGEN